MKRINYNQEKANEAVLIMANYYEKIKTNAEVLFPKSIKYASNEYFIYIFYSCLLDYGMRSSMYHDNLIKTYEEFSKIFDPKYVVSNYKDNSQELLDIIKSKIHARYPNVALKKWISLSEFLALEDDMLGKLNSFESFEELRKYITGIHGFGQKTGGLLIRLIYDALNLSNKYSLLSIPIDRHDIEISYLLGVVDKKDLNEKEIKMLSDVWIEASIINNVSPSSVDEYLWAIGSKLCVATCAHCPLNKNCKRK